MTSPTLGLCTEMTDIALCYCTRFAHAAFQPIEEMKFSFRSIIGAMQNLCDGSVTGFLGFRARLYDNACGARSGGSGRAGRTRA
jgi:hypothetical protein